MNASIKDLKSRGLVRIPYPNELRAAVYASQSRWVEFCYLRNEIKRRMPYDSRNMVGYELKERKGPASDRKENFDVTLGGRRLLRDMVKNAPDEGFLREAGGAFVESALELMDRMRPSILSFGRDVEEEFGLAGFAQEVEDSQSAFFVRFIHYLPGSGFGEEIAAPHCDQSGFTLHLFETCPGLQYLGSKERWRNMPVSHEETVIIPSMQMQLRSENRIRALCHRVVNMHRIPSERFSAVCFVQLKDTPKYDKERHGRLQEKKPGFNYSMPFEEFKDLFKRQAS